MRGREGEGRREGGRGEGEGRGEGGGGRGGRGGREREREREFCNHTELDIYKCTSDSKRYSGGIKIRICPQMGTNT